MWAVVTPTVGFGGVITKDFHERTRSTMEMQPQVFGYRIAGAWPQGVPHVGAATSWCRREFDVELIVKSDQPPEQLALIARKIVEECNATVSLCSRLRSQTRSPASPRHGGPRTHCRYGFGFGVGRSRTRRALGWWIRQSLQLLQSKLPGHPQVAEKSSEKTQAHCWISRYVDLAET